MTWASTRKKPYTETGIKRLRCIGCGERAFSTWSVCADNNVQRPVCKQCDVKLNALALEFFEHPNRKQLMLDYIRKVL
jgi:transcription elongation factor Elf1